MARIKKVLSPYQGIAELGGGVGTPNIVYDPRREKHWLVFTGWDDPTGSRREVWVAPVDSDLSVDRASVRKIIPSDFPEREGYTNNTVRAIYNAVRDQFVLTTTHGRSAYLYYFRPDWTMITYKKIIADGVGDHSVPIRPFGCYGKNHDALSVIPRGQAIVLAEIDDVDDVDKAAFKEIGVVARWGRSNDVLDLATVPRLAAFVEEDATNKWLIHSFLGPSLDDVNYEFLKELGLLHGSLMPLLGLSDEFVQVGHPHYTTEPDGVPKLLFASFRDSWSSTPSTSREGYAHEIWSVEVGPEIFKNESYGVLSDRALVSEQKGKWYFVGNAKTLSVLVTGVKSETTIEISEKANADDEEVKTKYELKENGKVVLDVPSPYVSVSASFPVSATISAAY